MLIGAAPAYSIDPIDNFMMMPAPVINPADPFVQEQEDVIYRNNKPDNVINFLNRFDESEYLSGGFESGQNKSSDTNYNRMPFFKKIRLKSTYKYREFAHKQLSTDKSSKAKFWQRKKQSRKKKHLRMKNQ